MNTINKSKTVNVFSAAEIDNLQLAISKANAKLKSAGNVETPNSNFFAYHR